MQYRLAVHGGVRTAPEAEMTVKQRKNYARVLRESLLAGHQILAGGGTSLDAVEAAVLVLEEAPEYNAGKGSVFTSDWTHELDAAIMDGATLKAGAVAGLKHIRNPIRLARSVMDHSPYVFLIGEGAEEFAREQGLEFVPNEFFSTEEKRLEAIKMGLSPNTSSSEGTKNTSPTEGTKKKSPSEGTKKKKSDDGTKMGTVGAVAIDREGNLASATSTGGTPNKKSGRIGDTPIIGAGTYANNLSCATSASGQGELFIRCCVGIDIATLVEYARWRLFNAMEFVVQYKLPSMEGRGGVIAIGNDGTYICQYNTAGMFRGDIGEDGIAHVSIFKEEING